MTPKISIVMPVYNVEKYLRECLDSVRAQTFTDWECICVDDGSTDASPAILDEYAAKDPRFRVIRREHSNAGAARNAGMDSAEGEFLSFLDSDDVFSPRMFETLHGAIKWNNADVATCRSHSFKDGERIPAFPSGENKDIVYENPARNADIFRTWVSWAWDKLFRAKFISDNRLRFQEIPAWNDMYFVDSALALADRVVSLNSILVFHRLHPGSIMAKNSGKMYFADSLLAFHDRILSGNSSKNENLEACYRLAILRNARFMIRDAKSSREFETIFDAAKVLALRFDADAVPERRFKEEKELLAFRSLLLGCESAADAIVKTMNEYARFQCLKMSPAWKTLRMASSPVRLVRRLFSLKQSHRA